MLPVYGMMQVPTAENFDRAFLGRNGGTAHRVVQLTSIFARLNPPRLCTLPGLL